MLSAVISARHGYPAMLLAEYGTHDELMALNGLYAKMVNAQRDVTTSELKNNVR